MLESEAVAMNFLSFGTLKSSDQSGTLNKCCTYNDFATFISQRENTGSLSYVYLPKADTFHHSKSPKSHLSISPPISLQKSLVGGSHQVHSGRNKFYKMLIFT